MISSDRIDRIFETVRYRITSNAILLNAWVNLRNGNLSHRNFGDELNVYLLKRLLPDCKLFNRNDICRFGHNDRPDYMVIGSLVEEFTTKNSIIWGAGAIEGGNRKLRNKPNKVLAVRGKLTRKYLMDNEVECPQVYGDPALLLPCVYRPESTGNKDEIGIIPHVSEINHPKVKQLVDNCGFKLVRFDKYDKWESVIESICSCKGIISTSLHGLIISDAYNIPNVWGTLDDNLIGGHFKFHDYFSGVNRVTDKPFNLLSAGVTDIETALSNWRNIKFDPKPLIDASPWHLKIV